MPNLILRLGGLGLLMYLGAIEKLMQDSGLIALFVNGSLLKDVTVETELTCEGYYQALNAHMVVYKALQALRLETFEDWVIDQDINTDFSAAINDLMLYWTTDSKMEMLIAYQIAK